MTGPVTAEALAEALSDFLAKRHPILRWQADASAIALIAGPLAPLLAAHQQQSASIGSLEESVNGLEAALQQVTAERDEARNPFGNFTPTVERIALLMGQVWLEAKGAAGDTVADFEEFAMLAPEDCADCCTVAKAVLGAVDPAKANERADAAEASLATATSELARLRAEGEAKDRRIATLTEALKPFAEYARLSEAAGLNIGPGEIGEFVHGGLRRSIHTRDLEAAHTALARAATAREGA